MRSLTMGLVTDQDLQRCYIGIGANLGDAANTVAAAVAALADLPGGRLTQISSLYRSAPVAASGPDFYNAVAEFETRLAPEALLDALQRIESIFGRQRPFFNAARTLDLDLLLHGDGVQQTPRLTLPHPRLHLRAFVLLPLLELSPDLALPGIGALAAAVAGTAEQRVQRLQALHKPAPTIPR